MVRISLVLGVLLFSFPVLSDTKQECGANKHWVDSHFRRAYTRYDGTRVRATQVKAHCRKNPRGYEKWHQRLSNSRPKIWGYKKEKSKKWSVEEVERIYDAISVLPDNLVNLRNVKIYRIETSKFRGNPAISNGNDISLYDEAFIHEDSLSQILSHELSHIIYRKLGKNDKDGFHHKAKWVKKEDNKGNTYYTTKREKTFIQPDSRDSMSEDFANHIEHYLFKNDSLRKNSKSAFQWIRTNFGENFKIQGEEK